METWRIQHSPPLHSLLGESWWSGVPSMARPQDLPRYITNIMDWVGSSDVRGKFHQKYEDNKWNLPLASAHILILILLYSWTGKLFEYCFYTGIREGSTGSGRQDVETSKRLQIYYWWWFGPNFEEGEREVIFLWTSFQALLFEDEELILSLGQSCQPKRQHLPFVFLPQQQEQQKVLQCGVVECSPRPSSSSPHTPSTACTAAAGVWPCHGGLQYADHRT